MNEIGDAGDESCEMHMSVAYQVSWTVPSIEAEIVQMRGRKNIPDLKEYLSR
jgi:hypothetical protein